MIPVVCVPGIFSTLTSGATMSDIMFLAKKEFDGKLRQNDGTRTTAGDLATLTATTGKDMYLAYAKVNIFDNASNFSITLSICAQVKSGIFGAFFFNNVSDGRFFFFAIVIVLCKNRPVVRGNVE